MAGRSVACIDRKVSKMRFNFNALIWSLFFAHLLLECFVALQGTGRYSVYVANYAKGNVGPHVLLEMDEAASDVTRGIVALSDVAAKAGVNKLTGRLVWICVVPPVRFSRPEPPVSAFAGPAGGRGVVVGPILNQWSSDVFCDNENGRNFMFRNNGDGTFVDVAQEAGECGTGITGRDESWTKIY